MKWLPQRDRAETTPEGQGPILIHALDGFLGAGSAARMAAEQLRTGHGQLIHEFDVDAMFDYRARRPMIAFREDHYAEYDDPTLQVVLEHDDNGMPYFLLAGPEPDFHWEQFVSEVHDVIEEHDVPVDARPRCRADGRTRTLVRR